MTWRALIVTALLGCGEPAGGDAAAPPLDAAAAPSVDAAAVPDLFRPVDGACPQAMGLVAWDGGRACVDVYEARVVARSDGGEVAWPPTHAVDGVDVRAVETPGTQPQAYISGAQADTACRASGKRLCTLVEWLAACRGPQRTTYPYGNTHLKGACNEGRAIHPVVQYFGTSVGVWDDAHLNNPGIDEQADTVSVGGGYPKCISAWGIYDLVGNLHEWIADPAGTFKGGYYVDAEINGSGCLYTTTAHAFSYHDYSTGFRCCSDAR